MKNIPDPDCRDRVDPERPGVSDAEPVVRESRARARWIPPVIAIAILVIVLVLLGVYYL